MMLYAPKEKNRFQKAAKIAREEGLKSLFIKLFLYFIYAPITYILTAISSISIFFKPKRSFFFQGKKLSYFYHRYNTTWKNERIVEVPIIMNYIKDFPNKRILEIGAVLIHYYSIKWDILDKYERGPPIWDILDKYWKGKEIINKDVVYFKPFNKYDLIISISTLEHVGFDEDIKDPTKIIKAIKNLKENCLNLNGEGIITMPIGYNLEMDRLLFTNKLEFDEKLFLKRINKENKWEEIPEKEARNIKYNKPFNSANSIVIGIIKK